MERGGEVDTGLLGLLRHLAGLDGCADGLVRGPVLLLTLYSARTESATVMNAHTREHIPREQ